MKLPWPSHRRPRRLAAALLTGLALALAAAAPTVWAAGGVDLGSVVVAAGASRGSVSLSAGTVVVYGTVDGSVNVGAGSVEVGRAGRVTGPITVGTGTVILAHGAQVGGSVTVGLGSVQHLAPGQPLPAHVRAVAVTGRTLLPAVLLPGLVSRLMSVGIGLPSLGLAATVALRILSWAVDLGVALAIYAMFPDAAARIERDIAAAPVSAGAWGLLILLAAGPAAVLLAITLVGIPLTLVLGLALLAAKVTGYAVVSALLGRRLVPMFGPAVPTTGWAVFVGTVLFLLIGSIPVIGALVNLAVACLGVGAAGRTGFGTGRPWFRNPPSPPLPRPEV